MDETPQTLKLEDFYKPILLSNIGGQKSIRLQYMPEKDLFVIFDDNGTYGYHASNTSGYRVEKGDVIIWRQAPKTPNVRCLYVADNAAGVAIAPSPAGITCLRRRTDAPNGMPAYVLPFFINVSSRHVLDLATRYGASSSGFKKTVLGLTVPEKIPMENETILGAMTKGHEIAVLRRQQEKLLINLQLGLSQMIMKNKRKINDPDEPETDVAEQCQRLRETE